MIGSQSEGCEGSIWNVGGDISKPINRDGEFRGSPAYCIDGVAWYGVSESVAIFATRRGEFDVSSVRIEPEPHLSVDKICNMDALGEYAVLDREYGVRIVSEVIKQAVRLLRN
jgi:hypothetical protein